MQLRQNGTFKNFNTKNGLNSDTPYLLEIDDLGHVWVGTNKGLNEIKFDEEMIWKLVRYVRQFSHTQEKDRLDLGREKLQEYKKSIGEGN